MYSDGSKSNSGHTGAGWAIFKMEREGLMSQVVQGSCYIGTQSEVRCRATCHCRRTTTD
jgi:hypothetical protein